MNAQTNTKITPNARQKECIDTLKGSVMVLAGPGTGKTFTVIERIKNMLDNNIDPSKILCLTFSDAAAGEMKRRLLDKAGQKGARVSVYTYHSFCWELIQNNIDYFEEFSNAQIITDTAKRSLMRQCIEESDTKYFKTSSGDRFFHTSTILDRIEEIKKNLITKEEYFYNLENHIDWGRGLSEIREKISLAQNNGKKVLKKDESLMAELEKKINRAREVYNYYELYTKKMRENNLIDFNDMISLVINKFQESPAFSNLVASEYDYFLVDEYQDTNKAQNTLIFNLIDAKEEKNIFVVGDDDQIIFSFQGAQIDNIEKFLKKYPDTKVICLNENMRSTQSILDLSEKVAQLDSRRLENNPEFKKYGITKHLIAKNPELFDKNTKPILNIYEDITQEYCAIVDTIEEIIKEDLPKLSEIAILTKTNGELEEFCELLKGRNIPYELKEGKSIFSVKSSILTIFYLKMLLNPTLYADKIFPLLLCEPFCININDYNSILAKSYLHKNRDFISDIYDMKDNKWEDAKKIEKLISDFEYLSEAKGALNLYALVLEVINHTGILNYFINCPADVEENIAALKKLVSEAHNFHASQKNANLADFIKYLDDALENNIPVLTEKSPLNKNAIQLVTLHSSKGREFSYVFIPTLEEYKWERSKTDTISPKIPLSKVITPEEKEELKTSEKIKLLFVGITRAKHKLFLSAPKTIGDKERRLSKYISQIREEYLERREILYTKENYLNELIKPVKYERDFKEDFQNFIRSSFESLSISPSMLNTYLKCPRQFLYSYVLRLGAFNKINDILNYGNVVHKTIENFSKDAKSHGRYKNVEDFIADFKAQCARMPFSERSVRNNFLKKGEENLRIFYNQIILSAPSKIFSTELNIETKVGTQIPINGKIDRIELSDSGDFIIKDFKTGSAKAARDIADGGMYEHYLNQLRFYKYLIEKKFDDKKVCEAQLVFVEQCDSNFSCNLTDYDSEIIENKIKEVYKNIEAQNFEPAQDKKNCANCEFCSMCSLNLL